ncbi:MAG: type III pantothenate kinase [Cytophaga sp.]|uniref:type III pantothenate kinase n=1 Tax=Cytophaga sp. TaxID=29535 RepID=UPI003F805615
MKQKLNMVVDVGNTFIKTGTFIADKLIAAHTFSSIEDVRAKILQESPENILVSSVRGDEVWGAIKDIGRLHKLDAATELPIAFDYETRQTLGTDRIAAAVGAYTLFPGQVNLFFDMGTCLTHGLLDQTNTFLGGSISPGVEMRLKALAHYTAKLPLLSPNDAELTGKSTSGSILSGVMNGILFEMEGFIQAYRNKYPAMNVLLTGGNASLFEKRLKEPIFAIAELNLIGLNRILTHNVY